MLRFCMSTEKCGSEQRILFPESLCFQSLKSQLFSDSYSCEDMLESVLAETADIKGKAE